MTSEVGTGQFKNFPFLSSYQPPLTIGFSWKKTKAKRQRQKDKMNGKYKPCRHWSCFQALQLQGLTSCEQSRMQPDIKTKTSNWTKKFYVKSIKVYLYTYDMIIQVFSRSDFLWSVISVSAVFFMYKEKEQLLLKHHSSRSFTAEICLIWYFKEIPRTSLFSYVVWYWIWAYFNKEEVVNKKSCYRANRILRGKRTIK